MKSQGDWFNQCFCISQDELGDAVTTNIPWLFVTEKQRFISCSLYISIVGQLWGPLLFFSFRNPAWWRNHHLELRRRVGGNIVKQALALKVLISLATASCMATPNFQEARRSILPPVWNEGARRLVHSPIDDQSPGKWQGQKSSPCHICFILSFWRLVTLWPLHWETAPPWWQWHHAVTSLSWTPLAPGTRGPTYHPGSHEESAHWCRKQCERLEKGCGVPPPFGSRNREGPRGRQRPGTSESLISRMEPEKLAVIWREQEDVRGVQKPSGPKASHPWK